MVATALPQRLAKAYGISAPSGPFWIFAGQSGSTIRSWFADYLAGSPQRAIWSQDNGSAVTVSGLSAGHWIPTEPAARVGDWSLTGKTSTGVVVVDFADGSYSENTFTLDDGCAPTWDADTARIYWVEWAAAHSGSTWAIQMRNARADFTDIQVVDGTVTGLSGSSTHVQDAGSQWSGTHFNTQHERSTFWAEIIFSASTKVSQYVDTLPFDTKTPSCMKLGGLAYGLQNGDRPPHKLTNPSVGAWTAQNSWVSLGSITPSHIHNGPGDVIGIIHTVGGSKRLVYASDDLFGTYNNDVNIDDHPSGGAAIAAYTLTEDVLTIGV